VTGKANAQSTTIERATAAWLQERYVPRRILFARAAAFTVTSGDVGDLLQAARVSPQPNGTVASLAAELYDEYSRLNLPDRIKPLGLSDAFDTISAELREKLAKEGDAFAAWGRLEEEYGEPPCIASLSQPAQSNGWALIGASSQCGPLEGSDQLILLVANGREWKVVTFLTLIES